MLTREVYLAVCKRMQKTGVIKQMPLLAIGAVMGYQPFYRYNGALTSKSHSFTKREWEVKQLRVVNFFEPTLCELTLEVKGRCVERVLPVFNFIKKGITLTTEVLSDRIRFFGDGINGSDRIFGFFTKRNGGWQLSSNAQFLNLNSFFNILYRLKNLNKILAVLFKGRAHRSYVQAVGQLDIFSSQLLSFSKLEFLKLYLRGTGFETIDKWNIRHRYSVSSSEFASQAVINYDFLHPYFFDGADTFTTMLARAAGRVFMVNLEVRFYLPALNLAIRQLWSSRKATGMPVWIINVGFTNFTNFPSFGIGFNKSVLERLLSGTHYLNNGAERGEGVILIGNESVGGLATEALMQVLCRRLSSWATTPFKFVTLNGAQLNFIISNHLNLSPRRRFDFFFDGFDVNYRFQQFRLRDGFEWHTLTLPTVVRSVCERAFNLLFTSHLYRAFYHLSDFLVPTPNIFEEANSSFSIFGMYKTNLNLLTINKVDPVGLISADTAGFTRLYFFKLFTFGYDLNVGLLRHFGAQLKHFKADHSVYLPVLNITHYAVNPYQEGSDIFFSARPLARGFNLFSLRKLNYSLLISEGTI